MDKYYKPGEQINGYSITEMLAEGRYGIVYLAESHESKKYIIKQLKKNMLRETKEKLFYEEVLLKKLDSPCFPKFMGKFILPNAKGYILEYMEGQVFEDLLMEDGHQFTKKEIYEIAFKMLDIIAILQKNNIVHRDIRPPNVILTDSNELILIDFGLARYIDNKKYVKKMDYWYLGDFLIHLYYTSYYFDETEEERPWYEELDLTEKEKVFLQRLLEIKESYVELDEIRSDLKELEESFL